MVEATSHALMLDRLRGCHFDAGMFTNLTSDHLDFHGTVEGYREAKSRLFRRLGESAVKSGPTVAVLNRDDPSYEYMRAASAAPVLSYGLRPEADVRAREVAVTAGGIRFRVEADGAAAELCSPMTGRFNVYNLLAALACGHAQGIDLERAAVALSAVQGVPGRMRRIDAGPALHGDGRLRAHAG